MIFLHILRMMQQFKIMDWWKKVVEKPEIEDFSGNKYKYGFVTDIEADTAPKGLNEDIIRLISAKKTNRNGCWNAV